MNRRRSKVYVKNYNWRTVENKCDCCHDSVVKQSKNIKRLNVNFKRKAIKLRFYSSQFQRIFILINQNYCVFLIFVVKNIYNNNCETRCLVTNKKGRIKRNITTNVSKT